MELWLFATTVANVVMLLIVFWKLEVVQERARTLHAAQLIQSEWTVNLMKLQGYTREDCEKTLLKTFASFQKMQSTE